MRSCRLPRSCTSATKLESRKVHEHQAMYPSLLLANHARSKARSNTALLHTFRNWSPDASAVFISGVRLLRSVRLKELQRFPPPWSVQDPLRCRQLNETIRDRSGHSGKFKWELAWERGARNCEHAPRTLAKNPALTLSRCAWPTAGRFGPRTVQADTQA